MRKELHNTKVTVRLRKSAYRNEWYLYIESYPVYTVGKSEPQRVREYLNRIVTTVVWDKTRTARTTSSSKSYKARSIKKLVFMPMRYESSVKENTIMQICIVTQIRLRQSKRSVCNKTSLAIFERRCTSDTKIAPLLFLSIGRELWIFLKCMLGRICRFSKSTMLLQRNTSVFF